MEPCPVATMDSFSRTFLARCHQQSSAPCMYCGRDYEWHVREGAYWENQDGAKPCSKLFAAWPPHA